MLETPPPRSAAICRWMSGFRASSTRHFGRSSERAPRRLPRPAARMTARIGLDFDQSAGFEKPGKQGNVIGGERFPALGMPHQADHATIRVPDSLDDSVIGNCPSHEWRLNLQRAEIMKAIHFDAPAIDRNTLAGR